MKRRAYLRTVGLAVPGLLLSGWASSQAAVRPVHLVVRDLTARDDEAASLRAGVELGLDDVARVAQAQQTSVVVHRTTDAAAPADSSSTMAVQVVVTLEDDRHPVHGTTSSGPRIYTCPLVEWRPDAWSVASPLSARRGPVSSLDWHPTLDTPEAIALTTRFARRTGVPMDEAAWRGWMAVKVAVDVALRAEAGEDDLLALRVDGHKGVPLRFSEDGHLIQPACAMVNGRAVFGPAVDHDLFADAD